MRRAATVAASVALAIVAPAQHDAAAEGVRTPTERAWRWLDEHVAREGWLARVEGNPRGQRVVAQSLLAWVAATRDADAERRTALDAAVRGTIVSSGFSDLAFATWMLGSTAFWVAECGARDGHAPAAAAQLVARLGRLRNSEGAWEHGRMEGTVSFYPSTVVAATNWALLALGAARAFGTEVPDEVIDDALALLGDVQAENGGIPYGGRPYRLGVEAGRTCGTVLAWLALDRGDTEACARACRYVAANLDAVQHGHASPAMHVLNGALCAFALGDAAWRDYERAVLARVLAAQRDDGSFDDAGGERSPDTLTGQILGDELTSRAYVSAMYTAALHVPKSRLARWLRARCAQHELVASEPPRPRDAAWTRPLANVVALAATGNGVAALTSDGELVHLAADDGRVLARHATGSATPADGPVQLVARGDDVLGYCGGNGALFAFDLAAGARRWRADLAPDPLLRAVARVSGEHVVAFDGKANVLVLRCADGSRAATVPSPDGFRCLAWPLADGAVVVSSDARIALHEPDGARRWHGRNRTDQAAVAPSWTALCGDGTSVFCGSSDGSVVARALEDGELRWRASLRTGVTQLALWPGKSDAVLALDSAGVLAGIVGGDVVWSVDTSRGTQPPEDHPMRFAVAGDGMWVHATGADVLVRVASDGTRGTVLACPQDAAWCASSDGVYVAGADGTITLLRT